MADAILADVDASGIYQIRNLVNGKVYIGSAKCFRQRWQVHLSQFRRGKHHSPLLQRAWSKYGENAFSFSVLALCDKACLIELEQAFLDRFSPEYNICRVAGSAAGRVTSEKTKALLSKAITGKKRSEETRAKMRHSRRKWVMPPVSAETRLKQSNARRGKPLGRTKEHAAKIGLARRKFTDAQIREMKARLLSGVRQSEVARLYSCSDAFVSNLANGKRYAEV